MPGPRELHHIDRHLNNTEHHSANITNASYSAVSQWSLTSQLNWRMRCPFESCINKSKLKTFITWPGTDRHRGANPTQQQFKCHLSPEVVFKFIPARPKVLRDMSFENFLHMFPPKLVRTEKAAVWLVQRENRTY